MMQDLFSGMDGGGQVRVAELSERTGVSVATIKYYLREGLLPRGERTGPNQAQYDDRHVRRLRLVRALVDIGGLSIAATRELLVHLDEPDAPLGRMLAQAMNTVTRAKGGEHGGDRELARGIVDELVERRGWRIDSEDPAYGNLVDVIAVIAAMRGPARDTMLTEIDRFARVAEIAARGDIEVVAKVAESDDAVEIAVVGTILGDTLISALRRLAQLDEAGRVFRPGGR